MPFNIFIFIPFSYDDGPEERIIPNFQSVYIYYSVGLKYIFEYKPYICRTFGQPSHVPWIPEIAVAYQHSYFVSFFCQLLLIARFDSVKHLEFNLIPRNAVMFGIPQYLLANFLIVCGERDADILLTFNL